MMGSRRSNAGRIVVVDPAMGTSLSHVLALSGYEVDTFTSLHEAIAHLSRESVDLVVSDVDAPGTSGFEIIARLRDARAHVPVVFVSAAPRIEGSIRASELGAFRHLAKPIDSKQMSLVVRDAVRWGRLARATTQGPASEERDLLEASFRSTLATIRMAYQPLVSTETRRVFGYEALMRSLEPELPTPIDVLEAAERLGRLHALGRRLRGIVAQQASDARPVDHTFFVNLHPSDLADPMLYAASAPLSTFARSVVLEITERASLEGIGDVERRIASLRRMGYRIAVDDLGAGYSGLSFFARISPDVVKIDKSLVRGSDVDPVKQRVVSSICTLARDLDVLIVAEGVETERELGCIRDLGADLVQGHLIARPAPYPTR